MSGLPSLPPVSMSPSDMSIIRPFMVNQAPLIGDAWQNAAVEFKRKRAEASRLMQTRTTGFKDFIGRLVKVSKTQELAHFNVNALYTFEDVKKEADKAVQAYKDQKSWRHPFRSVGRALGDAPAFEALLTLLPTQSLYASVVCGGLVLLYGAASSMSKVRRKIFDALESLSGTVQWSSDFLEVYESDDELYKKAEELYLALLDGIEGMMEWLDHKAYFEAVKSLFQQETYGKPVEKRIELIEEKSKAFQKRIEYLLHQRALDIHNELQTLRHENRIANRTLIGLFQGIIKDANWFSANVLARIQRMEQNQQVLPWVVQQQLLASGSQPQITLDEVFEALAVDIDVIASDANVAFLRGASLDMSSQDRIAWIFQDPRYQLWFRSQESAMLLIDASITDEPVNSGLGYFAVSLAQVLRQMAVTSPMMFFCGYHTSPEDPLQGAVGILRTLNSQLIPQLESFSLAFFDSKSLEDLRQFDIFALCHLFQGLLEQDQSSVFFIIVDEIAMYGTPHHSDDIRDLVRFLRDLTEKFNAECAQNQRQTVLKILMTCSTCSYEARAWFLDDEVLTIPLDAHGQNQGFNELHISYHTQQLFDANVNDSGVEGA